MSDDIVSRLKSPEVFISIGGMTSLVAHEAADHIEAQAAEITRLRAELATARRDGMEQLERYFRDAAAGTPLGYEDHQRGASVYNWLMYCATTIATIRAAAEEVK